MSASDSAAEASRRYEVIVQQPPWWRRASWWVGHTTLAVITLGAHVPMSGSERAQIVRRSDGHVVQVVTNAMAPPGGNPVAEVDADVTNLDVESFESKWVID